MHDMHMRKTWSAVHDMYHMMCVWQHESASSHTTSSSMHMLHESSLIQSVQQVCKYSQAVRNQ